MNVKRMLAYLLAICLAFSPVLIHGTVYASNEASNETVSGSDTVTPNDANAGIMLLSVSPGDAPEGAETFDGSDIGTWGFVGGANALTNYMSVAADGSGNKYLQINGTDRSGDWTATKTFADTPLVMKTAELSFAWYTGKTSSTSNGGYIGIGLRDGDTEIISLYLNDMRGKENKQNESPLYYTANGSTEKARGTGSNFVYDNWYNVRISVDFENNLAKVYVDEAEVISTNFDSEAISADTLVMGTYGTKVSFTAHGIDNVLFDYTTDVEDFEGNDIGIWGFVGGSNDLAQFMSVAAEADGNKYLSLTKTDRTGSWTATKTFSDVPEAMTNAELSFKWYTGKISSTSNAGYIGVSLQNGDTEIISLYLNDMRGKDGKQNESPLYYTANGSTEKARGTGSNFVYDTWYDVKISVDFENNLAKVYVDGAEVINTAIDATVTNANELMLFTEGNKVSFTAHGIDDVAFAYIEDENVNKEAIASLAEIADVTVTKAEWATYSHPTTVDATLINGNVIEVPIDSTSWTCTPAFNENVKDVYTWTANINPPAANPNTNGLTVSYNVLYKTTTTSEHDYENDFTFDEEISAFKAWSKAYAGNDGGFTTSLVRDTNNNRYMNAVASGNGDRGTRLDVPGYTTEIVRGTSVQFDWMPIACNDKTVGGQILFVSPGTYHSYFTVRFDQQFNLYYYTETPIQTTQNSFTGIITEANAVSTGLGGQNKWFTVKVDFDYASHTADLTITEKANAQNTFTATDIPIEKEANGLQTFLLHMDRGENGASATMGLDNLVIDYDELGASDITAVATLSDVKVTQAQWDTYTHPTKVEVSLADGSKTNVTLGTWTSEPAFDKNVAGIYTWSAPLVTGELSNMFGLTATYRMSYVLSSASTHDYENTFDVSTDAAAITEWSKSMDSTSGTGKFTVTVPLDENLNGYLNATVSAGGERGSRLDIDNSIVKAAEVQFDWMPVTVGEGANGQLMFLAPDKWHSYFTLRVDKDYKLSYFTENPLTLCATTQEAFDGSISADSAVDTGLSGANKWYTVNIKFDYLTHTADLTITEKDNESNKFVASDIKIETEANGMKSFVLHMNKITGSNTVTMNIDNLTVDYDEFGATDIISIEQPADIKVAKVVFDDYEFPTEVVATLGDLSKVNIPVGNWTATPTFDKETEAIYTWTAPLINGEYSNMFNLVAEYDMDYTMLPFPLYVHNPNTVELEFGEAMPTEFPTEVVAFMSDGTTGTMAVGEWTAIREFNAAEEGIYVYGANLVETEGRDQIVREQLNRNENHDDHGSDKAAYQYDVYYRISYFKTQDNYNAYTRSMEYLDRGVYAIPANNGIFVSWRLLVTEYGEDVAFNIYRNGELVNEEPITSRTNYVDTEGNAGDVYTVEKLQDGLKYVSEEVVATDKSYMSIPLQRPAAQPSVAGEMAEYTINDAGVADVDGDGQYEVIVKWYPTNSFDSGKAVKPSSPTIFDVYEMDGTALWRLNLGLELPSGAHFNQFMFYDLDEDGKAELFLKTSDGVISYKPNANGQFDMTDESTIVSYIGDRSVVPGTNVNANGHMSNTTNEYVTVFNGQTGEEIHTIDFVNTTGQYSDWGYKSGGVEDDGNRSARYNIAIAYLPESEGSTDTIPAVLFNRGYYDKTTVAAYTLRDGQINLEWNFVALNGTVNAGKGNHNMSTGDFDNDGFDELVIGALAIDHNGEAMWSKDAEEGRDFSGHADAIHLAVMTPESNQLYVMVPSEEKSSTLNYSITNPDTGARIAGQFMTKADIGRGIAANITPLPGYEYWANVPNSEIANQAPSGAIYNFYGEVISQVKPVNFTTNWRLFWDGDLLSELPDSYNPSVGEGAMSIFKYDWVNNAMNTLVTFEGTALNNATKNNPSLSADLFGDWREEVMLRSADNTELRIYMTNAETDYMIYTLMHDPVYRNCIANQNTSYNQPPQLGFYLGEDNKAQVLAMELPTAKIAYTTEEPTGEVDKTDLQALIEEAEALEEADYTEESWSALAEALEKALEEVANENATNESIAAVLESLEAAIANLVEKVEDPVEPEDPTEPENPVEPEDPADPEEPDMPEEPSDSDDTEDSEDSDDSGSTSAFSAYEDVKVDWNQVNADLKEKVLAATSKVESVLNVVTGGDIVVPKQVLQTLLNKNTTLAMHVGGNVAFSISGKNVTRAVAGKDLKLDVALNGGRIPTALVNEKMSGAVSGRVISIANQDSFGMVVNMHVGCGAENAGKYANLYRYNAQTKTLEYCGSFQIVANGQAMFGLHQGGDYLVTVTTFKPNEKLMGIYTVVKGDTLSRIAVRHGISLSRLLAANPQIKNPHLIRVGQKINIR